MNPRQSYLHIGLIITALIILAAIAVPEKAAANPGSSARYQLSSDLEVTPGLISCRQDGVQQASSSQPWSPTRLEAAQPYPLPSVDALPQVSTRLNDPGAEPVYIPSVPPGNSSSADGDPFILNTETASGYEYPAPYTRFENFDSYQVFPYSANGVLFFSQRGSDFRCSASVVGENAVWTAAHCLHDGSGELEGCSEDVVFIPAYEDGSEPFGRWEFSDLVIDQSWYDNGDLRFDFGGVILNPNGSDQSVQEVVGSLGFAFNLDIEQHWFNIAYPSEFPFDGKSMQICAGSFARLALNPAFPVPIAMGCDMTKGSSGGAWITNFSGSSGGMNFLNGNNSFRYTGFGEEIYSPYFGEAAEDLLNYISTDTRMRSDIHIPLITHSEDD
jgi:V8-like Glu-specific endopeptidase